MRALLDTSALIGEGPSADAEVARAWRRLAAAVAERGGEPRRRQIDLAIAATAQVQVVPLITHNAADFCIIGDLINVRPL